MGKKKDDAEMERRGDAETGDRKQEADKHLPLPTGQGFSDKTFGDLASTQVPDEETVTAVETQVTPIDEVKEENPPAGDSEEEQRVLQALAEGGENTNAVKLMQSFLEEHFGAKDLTTPFEVVDFATDKLLELLKPPSKEKALEVLRSSSNDELAAMQTTGNTLLLNVGRIVFEQMPDANNLEILDGRVLHPGTEVKLGTDTVTLASKALITFPQQGRESYFAGMLATSHPDHLKINAKSLKWRYNQDARLLPIEQQGLTLEEILALSDEERELFGLPKKVVNVEL